MKIYIEVESLINDLRKLADKHHAQGDIEFADGVREGINKVKAQTTAHVQEIVHGEWINVGTSEFDETDRKYRCSNCSKEVNGNIPAYFAFCHKCGAKMKVEG